MLPPTSPPSPPPSPPLLSLPADWPFGVLHTPPPQIGSGASTGDSPARRDAYLITYTARTASQAWRPASATSLAAEVVQGYYCCSIALIHVKMVAASIVPPQSPGCNATQVLLLIYRLRCPRRVFAFHTFGPKQSSVIFWEVMLDPTHRSRMS